jgi:hypothetical protein
VQALVDSESCTSGTGATPRLGDVLSQIDGLKQSLLQLSADVVKIRGKEISVMDRNASVLKKPGITGNEELESHSRSFVDETTQSPFLDKPPRRHSPVSYGTSRGVADGADVSIGSPPKGGGVVKDQFSTATSTFDTVVQSFLDVVGKCSEVTSKV